MQTCGEFHHEVASVLAQLGGYDVNAPDCAAIKQFQQRYGLEPVDGIAGKATNDVAQRLAASDPAQCEAGPGTVACVDLTHQTTWLMRDGTVVYGPTVIRTGMAGHVTPTGSYEVEWRSLKSWSVPYEVWLPHWQSFNGDIGFHQTTSYLHDASLGSHGCVNLLPADAVAYWDNLEDGSTVQVFGHRTGT
ncbi:MAG TPA: L,D-transpeptidase family protein [Candidatus Limnocylindrales bacterium]